MLRILSVVLVLLSPAISLAEDAGVDAAPAADSAVDAAPSATVVEPVDPATLPRPEEASGEIASPRESAGWRWLPRILLFVPRAAVEIAALPLRGGIYLYDRYNLRMRAQDVFFNDEGTIGVYPVALFETGFGLNVGGRMVHKDLFGEGERLRVRASYGGRFRQFYSVKVDSGRRLGGVKPTLEFEYRILPDSGFFGVGNGDLVDAVPGMPLIDARRDATAVRTRFSQKVTELQSGVSTSLVGPLSGAFRGVLRWRSFDEADSLERSERNVSDVYDPMTVTGFTEGLANLYGELILTYDTRVSKWRHVSKASPSTGWKIDLFGGLAYAIDAEDPTEFQRYGLDVTRYVDVWRGDRVLVLRALVDAVSGSLHDVPFVDLPRLGGPLLLRGYDQDRFRDRAATLYTAEYNFPIDESLGGFLFADSGRVWRSLSDVTLEDYRLGYGGGVQLHTDRSFLARVQLASSVDGGFFVYFTLDPVYDTRSRIDAL